MGVTEAVHPDRPAAELSEPAGISVAELQLAARNHGMPLEALREPVTPVGLHYLLTHYDIPQVDAAAWRLVVDGRVEAELTLGLDDLRALPPHEVVATMECAGNGRARLDPRPVSQPWLLEAVGTGRWRGARLRDVLDRAGVEGDAVEVLFTGLDRGIENDEEQLFQRSLTLADARGEDVLLAYELNGAPLPPQHGFPLRLLVPGWYGMTNVKWLARITVLDRAFDGYQQARGYRLRRDEDDPGTPLTRMLPRALMVPPGIPEFMSRERTLDAGRCAVDGRAWSGQAPISAVDVSTDGGASWSPATLDPPGARPLGLAPLELRLGRGARAVRPLLPRAGRGRERAAGRCVVERRRLREQRGAARRRPRSSVTHRALDGAARSGHGSRPREEHARRDARTLQRRRMRGAVRGGRNAVGPPEARRERADAPEPDREADVGDRAIRVTQQRGGSLEPPRQQVLVRCVAERPPELAAEVRRRELRRPRERRHVERVAVTRVDQVLCPQQMPRRGQRPRSTRRQYPC